MNTKKIAELAQFYNKRSDGKFTIRDSLEIAYQASAETGPIALSLSFHCSTESKRKDPLVLSYSQDHNAKLNMTIVSVL